MLFFEKDQLTFLNIRDIIEYKEYHDEKEKKYGIYHYPSCVDFSGFDCKH